MKYGSVCSGIEAATVAWHGIGATMCMTCEGLGRYNGRPCGHCHGRGYVGGWEPAFFSEIEKFPCAVLAHHYPEVPNHGDLTRFSEWPDAALDVLVGGTPCQSFSVAGLRKGLADPRGNLMLTYLAIAERYRPRWLVWENVPGVLSSNGGRDFGSLLGGLGQLGYGWAYRVLDAQYFGVAQRRRRVFVVGHLGDWRPAAAVLFERHSLQGHPAPSRQKGKGAAAGFETGPSGGRFTDVAPTMDCRAKNGPMQNQLGAGVVQPLGLGQDGETARALNACHTASGRHDVSVDTFVAQPILEAGARTGKSTTDPRAGSGIGEPGAPMFTLQAGKQHAVAQPLAFEPGVASRVGGHIYDDISGTLRKEPGDNQMSVVQPSPASMAVRRLTPVECERLQGFSDNYTAIPYRGKPAADGPRYKALGNSMAVPVMSWIGRRIQQVENILIQNRSQP